MFSSIESRWGNSRAVFSKGGSGDGFSLNTQCLYEASWTGYKRVTRRNAYKSCRMYSKLLSPNFLLFPKAFYSFIEHLKIFLRKTAVAWFISIFFQAYLMRSWDHNSSVTSTQKSGETLMYYCGHKTYQTYYTQKFLVLRKSVKNAHTTRAKRHK